MTDVTLSCAFNCSSVDGCQGHCEAPDRVMGEVTEIEGRAQIGVSPELVEQMMQLIRDLHADHIKHGAHDYIQDFVARTAAIVSVLPKPVDPDLIKAREICNEICLSWFGSEWNERVKRGEEDDSDRVRVALAAIKRGRALATQATGHE